MNSQIYRLAAQLTTREENEDLVSGAADFSLMDLELDSPLSAERGSIHSTIHSILLHDLHRNPEDGNPFSPFHEYAGGAHDFVVQEEEGDKYKQREDHQREGQKEKQQHQLKELEPLKEAPFTKVASSLLSPRSLSGSARRPLHASQGPTSSSSSSSAAAALSSSPPTTTTLTTATPKSHRRIVSEAKSLSLKLVDAMTVSEKLKVAFDLPSLEEYQSEFSCWLVKSVLLQGCLFLTSESVCFYAKLPEEKGAIQRSGFLSKKSKKRQQYFTNWFILRDDMLSYYGNAKELYYPIGSIDLRKVISVEPSKSRECGFKIRTANRAYHFQADTKQNQQEWRKAIEAAAFRHKHEGQTVRIVLPLANISEIKLLHSAMFADSLMIKIVDEREDAPSVDEYYFAYFQSGESVFQEITRLKEKHNRRTGNLSSRLDSGNQVDSAISLTGGSSISMTGGTSMPTSPVAELSPTSPKLSHSTPASPVLESMASANDASLKSSLTSGPMGRPNSTTSHIGEWSVVKWWSNNVNGMRSSLPKPSLPWQRHRKSFSDATASSSSKQETATISTATGSKWNWAQGLSPSKPLEIDAVRRMLPLPATETQVRFDTGCYLVTGVLPRFGRIIFTSNYLSFVSRIGIRTKLVVPLLDIDHWNKASGVFYHGLCILTKDQNEMWFEFHSEESRDRCIQYLQGLNLGGSSLIRPTSTTHDSSHDSLRDRHQRRRTFILQELHRNDTKFLPTYFSESQLTSLPAIVTPSEAVLRKSEPTHITCLTIGTRGDVQPFIALCKGLMKHGHRCRIATHSEYKDWIESHGIEFRYIGGNPADLMQLCVENGMFSISFLREAASKFREWIDDLLQTAWEACQGTNVLIESPVAMAGFHIAERLNIPYFAAFPMPWTKTREFPHPFAIAETNLGTGYNRMTWVLLEQVLWRGIQGQINRWRKNVLGLASLSEGNFLEDDKVSFLYSFSPSVVNPPIDWSGWVHICGYWFLDNPDHGWRAPQALLDFLERKDDKKLVYVGFGSIIVNNPDEIRSILVEAVKKAGVRAVMGKGWSARKTKSADSNASEEETTADQDIYCMDSVPHDWLFPMMDAVVHHGGAGTTSAGLRAGKPTIIRPFFGDQYFWASRVEEMGAGIALRKLDVDTVAAALVRATTNSKMINRAKLAGDRIRGENGVETAIQIIHRDIEYQRSSLASKHRRSSVYQGIADQEEESRKARFSPLKYLTFRKKSQQQQHPAQLAIPVNEMHVDGYLSDSPEQYRHSSTTAIPNKKPNKLRRHGTSAILKVSHSESGELTSDPRWSSATVLRNFVSRDSERGDDDELEEL